MKYKLFALATVVLLLSAGAILLCPDNELKWRDLQDIDAASASRAQELSGHENVTVTDLAAFELLKCNVPEDQLGAYPNDWRSMASSVGITDNISRGWDEAAHRSDLNNAINDSMSLAAAFRSGEASEPFFAHGEAQPVFRYTSIGDNYSNRNSEIIRYCVYVETEYDTDSDGKRDLVKVLIQVPRAAMEGHYKAPVILEMNPYECGTIKIPSNEAKDSYDLSKLYSQPDKRQVKGYEDPLDLAYATDKSDWAEYIDSVDDYNYFLVRGYAFAICAGLGTKSSEGFQVCGTDLELKCYKSVIEWFDGKAVAFTDKERCIETRAEWSEGGVGTTGISYLGTIQIGLAAMGVDNLRTIVAEGAISNWYEYACCQGAAVWSSPYTWWLTAECTSLYSSWEEMPEEYHDYISKIAYDEALLKGAYYDGGNTFWQQRDYTRNAVASDTAILLFHGLNDFNVKTKQFDLTYRMFERLGMDVHAVLHQGGHQHYEVKTIMMGDMTSVELYNRWYSCYLFHQDNGIADEFKILVQSNVDGSWENYDNLDSVKTETFRSSESGTCDISVEGQKSGIGEGTYKWVVNETSNVDTINGAVKITFRASTNDVNIDQVRVAVSLRDVCDSSFSVYNTEKDKVKLSVLKENGTWVGSNLSNYILYELQASQSTSKEITIGYMELHCPRAVYESDTAVRQEIKAGEMYEYTLYLQPTLYTLQEGHHLEVVFGTYIDSMSDYGSLRNYSYQLDISSITMEMGTV